MYGTPCISECGYAEFTVEGFICLHVRYALYIRVLFCRIYSKRLYMSTCKVHPVYESVVMLNLQ
jgi:hypothetical protein